MRHRKYCYLLAAVTLLCGCQQHTPSADSTSAPDSSIEFTSSEASEAHYSDSSAPEASSIEEIETTEDSAQTLPSESENAETEERPTESEAVTVVIPEDTELPAPTEPESETSIVFYSCDDMMYITKDANIRLAPSLDAGIYDVYAAGTAVQCIARSDEWTIISIGTGTYYISSGLLSPEDPAKAGSTEQPPETQSAAQTGSEITPDGILYTVGAGPLVCIDAGHQGHGNSETEPDGPGSATYKAKVTTGTSGVASGLTEAQLNLAVSCQLRDELIARGYNVLMIRESQDVDISNSERAQMANNAGADIFVRIHANGSDNADVSGVLTMSPTAANPYIASLYPACHSLSECVVNAICAETGAVNRGVYETDTMSGINWAAIPVTIVEMGYMTNPAEDLLMASPDYQAKIVNGIANGIDSYFGR